MYLLHQWGYQTISVELLARAIKEGAELPPKPIILTFDDGSRNDIYQCSADHAKIWLHREAYIVYNYVGITDYMNADQIRGLYAAGWEIGSHSLSHVDLTIRPDRQKDEIVESRRSFSPCWVCPF